MINAIEEDVALFGKLDDSAPIFDSIDFIANKLSICDVMMFAVLECTVDFWLADVIE
jgi:hypothetical protein